MNEVLELAAPFYLPEAVTQFVRPVMPNLINDKFSADVLEYPACCEALNEALKASIDAAR